MNSNLFAYQADLAATSFGDVLAAYMYDNGAVLQIQSVESDIDAAITNPWSIPINVSASNNNAFPRIAAALSGNVINAAAVWLTTNGGFNSVAASAGSRTLVLPPTNLNVVQHVNNFGVFSEFFNTLSWQASKIPMLRDI